MTAHKGAASEPLDSFRRHDDVFCDAAVGYRRAGAEPLPYGRGALGGDYVAGAIAALDNVSGDIDTLQHRIASIRSWAYIAQRPDWVVAKDEMAARARAVEARLSDALHARLTERFVNRRTAVLMKKLGPDAALLPVELAGEQVLVAGEAIGALKGFRFVVDPTARHSDRKLLLAVIEKFGGGPVGLENLAHAIGEEADTIEDVLEPYLIQQGFLQRTPRGRMATLAAYRHFGIVAPSGAHDLLGS